MSLFSYLNIKVEKKEKWSTQSCLTLCDPMDFSLPGSSIQETSQAKVLEWLAISFSRVFSQSRDRTWVSYISGRRFTIRDTKEAPTSKVIIVDF